jgi:serine protease Do
VILRIDDTAISQFSELPTKVAELKPGTRAKVYLWRKDGARDVTVVVGEVKEPG